MRKIVTALTVFAAFLLATEDISLSSAEVRVADAAPELVLQTGHIRSADAIAVSPDNRWIATGSFDNTVKIWDAESGRELRSLTGHSLAVRAVAVAPGGKLLVSGGVDGMLRFWDVVTGAEQRSPIKIDGTVETIAFSADGARLASGGSGKAVFVHEVASGSEVARLAGHVGPITVVAFAADGNILASGSADKSVRIWDLAGKSAKGSALLGHADKVRVLRFNPADDTLASGAMDNTVRLWRVADGGSLAVDPGYAGSVQALYFRSATELVSVDSKRAVKIWNTSVKTVPPAGKPLGDKENEAKAASFSPDGRVFATAEGSGSANLYDAATGQVLTPMESHTVGFYGVAFSNDRRWMAAASYDNTVKLWDLSTGESLAAKRGHGGRVSAVAFHPDNRRLISGSIDGTLKVWDTFMPGDIGTLRGHKSYVSTLAVGAKGKLLVTGGSDRQIGVWDLSSLKAPGRFLAEHTGEVTSVAISPDERFVVSGSSDGTFKIWDAAQWNVLSTLEPKAGSINAVAVSGDSKLIATGGVDGIVRIWNAESKSLVHVMPGHAGVINSLTFAPTGDQLVSSGLDRTVRIWEASAGREVRTLSGHAGAVKSSAFTADGKWLASASEDGSIVTWATGTGQRAATLLSIKNGNGWLVASPQGFFDGSPGSGEQLLWRFEQDTFNTKPVEVFFEEFFVPGLLADVFENRKLPAKSAISTKDRRQPELTVTRLEDEPGAVGREAKIRIEVTSAPAGAKDLRLFRNGSLVQAWRGDVLKGGQTATVEVKVPIVAGPNRLTAYAFNKDDVKSRDRSLNVIGPPALARKGIAYIFAVGVNKYANPNFNLDVAVKDAETFADEIKGQQAKIGAAERIEPVVLSNDQATKANILAKLKELALKVQPEDSLTIFYAGHGLAVDNRFYLIPHDIGYQGLPPIEPSDFPRVVPGWISDVELGEAVEKIDAGQMLLVLDACNSGKALDIEEKRRGPMNSKGLAQLAYEKGMYILTASQAFQDAKEDIQLGHGYLTYALVIDGLGKRAADHNPKDDRILLREWLDYATDRVPQIDREDRDSGKKAARGIGRQKPSGLQSSQLQRPRVFYRRESESRPVLIAQY